MYASRIRATLLAGAAAAIAMTAVFTVQARTVHDLKPTDVAAVRAATAPFHNPQKALDAGWAPQPGLDSCFKNPGVGGMGFHYINANMLDDQLDPIAPEAMVYAPGPNGQLQLGAVEWIVPAAAWDPVQHGGHNPELLGQELHLEPLLGVYVLHAWIFKNNPSGMLEDWNPRVSCP